MIWDNIDKMKKMLMKQRLFFILIVFFLISCNNENKENIDDKKENKEHLKNKVERTTTTDGVDVSLLVTAKFAPFRVDPDPGAEEILRLKEGENLEYLNVLSTFTTPMKIQGIEYDEPWLKAKTKDGKEGWIYAGAVSFKGMSDKKLAELVFDRRLFKLLGDDLTHQLKVYQKEMADLRSLPAFRMLFRRSEELRTSIDNIVNQKLALAPKDSLPDFFWLNEAFPGFIVHLVNKNKKYRLFRNFAQWKNLSEQTTDKSDDLFVEVYLKSYRSDSIEYVHADWRMELENEHYSLLGRGIHKEIFDAIELALAESDDFRNELMRIKLKLLDDISFSLDFWESKENILKELDDILKTEYKMLSKTERVELASKRKMIQSSKNYDIRTGLFDGGE